MPDLYYKATRPDGRDFHSGTVDYAAALVSGEVIRHPAKLLRDNPETYLSVSVEPANCTGMAWPCRLFRVEPVGPVATASDLPSKRCVSALRVVEELPAHMALGPNGEAVARLIESCRTISPEQARRLAAAWAAARDAAWDAAWAAAGAAAWDAARDAAWDAAWAAARDAARDAAWDAAWAAARDAAWDAAWAAAWDAARALVVRDLISPDHLAILTGPWVSAMGETWESVNV